MAFFLSSNSKQILKKIKSFSHGEYNDDIISEKIIEKKFLKMRIFLEEII